LGKKRGKPKAQRKKGGAKRNVAIKGGGWRGSGP